MAKATRKPKNELPSSNTVYFLSSKDRQVVLNVDLRSPGHSCVTTVKLDDKILLQGAKGSISDFNLGLNAELDGKTLHIATTITNLLGEQDVAQADIKLSGGATTETTNLKDVIKQGESSLFASVFRMKKI